MIFNYSIDKSKIGRGTIIDVIKANLIECKIGRHNTLVGPMSIEIHKKASMGPGNMIQADSVELNNIRSFIMAENSRIGRDHHIDIADSFFLGKNSCIAGKSSQFWTHGAGMQEGIFIGENCYIGSAVRFKPGTSIGDNSIVGLGSVVTKKFNSKNVTIAGQPAKILKENYN